MISFFDVAKIFEDGSLGLKDINLSIEKGDFVYVVGKSGAGKSTFIKLLTLEEYETRGKILIDNLETKFLSEKDISKYRRDIGIVFQDFKLIEEMSVFENISYRLELIGMKYSLIKKKVSSILSVVGLEDKMKCMPSELSGGEQQRVAIARACVVEPKILLADEPTANLDYQNAVRVVELFKTINLNGTTVIIATHDEAIRNYLPSKTLEVKNHTIFWS